jgi:hypothetical protein
MAKTLRRHRAGLLAHESRDQELSQPKILGIHETTYALEG